MKASAVRICMALLFLAACGDDDEPPVDAGADGSVDAGMSGSGGRGGRGGAGAGGFPGSGTGGRGGAGMDAGNPMDAGDAGLADKVARGDYLVNHIAVCSDCHTPRLPTGAPDMTKFLSGVECFADADPTNDAFGCLHSRNLTNHETGLKNRSDQEIKDMFMKGEKPDGKALHPVMPYYVLGNMSEDDADAIVAYLRTVEGVDHMVPPSQPPFTPPDAPAPRWPEATIPMPDDDYPELEAAMRGRYLAGNIGICMECHTKRDQNMSPILDLAFQGGEGFGRDQLGLPALFPEVIYSANITPHANGIEGWSVQDIVDAIKRGEDKDQGGAPLCPPMPSGPMGAFGGMTDEDAEDIAHYLLSIPPGDNVVPADCVPGEPIPPDDDAGVDAGG